jgi:zona occludens toxin (predicted ATPase)
VPAIPAVMEGRRIITSLRPLSQNRTPSLSLFISQTFEMLIYVRD